MDAPAFVKRLWSWAGGGRRGSSEVYESLPLTDDRGLPSTEEYKEEAHITTGQKRVWLKEAAKPGVRLLWALVPFFIARPLGKTDRSLPKTTSTTYLNGIRGLACWIVFNHHLSMDIFRDWLFLPYGAIVGEGDDAHPTKHILQLPIVRILHCGKAMVCLFFVLSGFVLAFSPLRKIINSNSSSSGNGNGNSTHTDGFNNNDSYNSSDEKAKSERLSDELLTSFSSGLLRRAIRLFAPLLILAVITAPITYLTPIDDRANSSEDFVTHLRRNRDWLTDIMNPYAWESIKLPRHYPQAWTLAQEYRLSLALFLMLLATCKLSTVARKALVVFVGLWSIYCDRRWDIMAFMGGILIVELRFAPLCQDVARLIRRPGIDLNIWVYKIFGTIAIAFGLLLCSWPEDRVYARVAPYKYLHRFIPKTWREFTDTEMSGSYLWLLGSIGSIMLIWGLEQLPLLRRALSCTALKYLGEISYALYLVHWLFQHYVFLRIHRHLTEDLEWRRATAFWGAYFPSLLITIVGSDYFWRAADEKCVKLARFFVTDILGVGAKHEKRPTPPTDYPTTFPIQDMDMHQQHQRHSFHQRRGNVGAASDTSRDDDTVPVLRLD